MGGLGRVLDSFWNRAFVANQLWLLIAVVTFGLMLLAGVLDLDLLARVVMVVGWFVLTPVFMFFGEEIAEAAFAGEEATDDAATDPLETLRDRYARGEISEAEFERRVERLLETEDGSTPHDAIDPDSDVRSTADDRERTRE